MRRRRAGGMLFNWGRWCRLGGRGSAWGNRVDGSPAYPDSRGIACGPLTGLDWIIIAFTVLMAIWGFSQGLIAGGLALVGFALGAFLGSRLGPLLLSDGSHSPYAPLVALLVALMLGGVFASVLEVAGFHLRGRLPEELGVADGVGGAVLVACLGLFL